VICWAESRNRRSTRRRSRCRGCLRIAGLFRPGHDKLSRLDDNNGSLAIKFTSDDLREIDSAASKITVQVIVLSGTVLRMSGR